MGYPQPQYPPATYYPAPANPYVPVSQYVEAIPGNGQVAIQPAPQAVAPSATCAHCGNPVSATVQQINEETLSRVARVEEYVTNMGIQLNWIAKQIEGLASITQLAQPLVDTMAAQPAGKKPNPIQLMRQMGGMFAQMQAMTKQGQAIESTATEEGADHGNAEPTG